MAKKDRDNAEQDEKKGGLLTVIIVLVIIAIWIAIFALLVHLDVGGLGTSLRPMLKDIPVINKILPPVSDEELAWENDLAYKDIVEELSPFILLFNDPDKSKENINRTCKQTIQYMTQSLGNVRKAENYHTCRTYKPRIMKDTYWE